MNKNNKEEVPTVKEFFTTNLFPDLLLNIFQLYLIADKVFSIDFFGELSWWQVFIPFWITFIFTAIFYDSDIQK